MERDKRDGNGVDYENMTPKNEYETIADPEADYLHTADPGAIYALPDSSPAGTEPPDTRPANNIPIETSHGESAQHNIVKTRRHWAYILIPGISIIIFAGTLGYLAWKLSNQNQQLAEHNQQIFELANKIILMTEECICPGLQGKEHWLEIYINFHLSPICQHV